MKGPLSARQSMLKDYRDSVDTISSSSSEVESLVSDTSVFSLVPSMASDSTLGEVLDDAIRHLVKVFVEDSELFSLYREAQAKIDMDRFVRNHERLLKKYYMDLSSIAHNDQQRRTIRFLRGTKQRHQMTEQIYFRLDPSYNDKKDRIVALSKQTVDSMENLNRLLRPQILGTFASPLLPREEMEDGSSSGSNNNNKIPSTDDDDDENRSLSVSELDSVLKFLTKGASFNNFKDNLRRFIYPSNTLEQALSSEDVKKVQRILDSKFDQIAVNEFSWLHELDEIGYTHREMAELLLESAADAPWIYFEKGRTIGSEILPQYHLPECVHLHGYNLSQSSHLITTAPKRHSLALLGLCRHPEEKDLKQTISELCGIAGVAPNSRDLGTWNGHVDFDEQNATASVTYDLEGSGTHLPLAKRIFNALENFCDAAGRVQQVQFCCDCFTVLRRLSAVNPVEVCQIKLELAVRFREEFKNLLSVEEIESSRLRNCGAVATDILRVLGYLEDCTDTRMTELYEGTADGILHTCSLAVQFLCVGFLSYNQAHTGAIHPFFLDIPLTNIQLLGSLSGEGSFPKINVQLVNLTCMGNMIQDAVIAFSMCDGPKSWSSVHDLLASPEDLMDTWGPGHFVTMALDASKNDIYAINIGGGTITRAEKESEKFHWSSVVKSGEISTRPFSRRTKMLIGTSVTVNSNCHAADSERWHNSAQYLENLGTYLHRWEPTERTIGAQGGQFFSLQGSQTFAKRPGNSLKQFQLTLPINHLLPFLECFWGVQVSFCTGIACRVPLRELVSDACLHSSTDIFRYHPNGSF